MFTCRERKGCPASFYLDSRCSWRQGKNCWELASGCPLINCGQDCKKCRTFYAPRHKQLVARRMVKILKR